MQARERSRSTDRVRERQSRFYYASRSQRDSSYSCRRFQIASSHILVDKSMGHSWNVRQSPRREEQHNPSPRMSEGIPGGQPASHPKFFPAISAIVAPMLSDAVAAGEGAFSTWIIRSASTNRKSSTRAPLGSTA